MNLEHRLPTETGFFLRPAYGAEQRADREEVSDECDHLCFSPRIADTTFNSFSIFTLFLAASGHSA